MDWKSLSLDEQAELLWDKGTLLASVDYYNHTVNLYLLNGKHYELWYSVGGNEIERIVPLSNPKLFRKHFRQN